MVLRDIAAWAVFCLRTYTTLTRKQRASEKLNSEFQRFENVHATFSTKAEFDTKKQNISEFFHVHCFRNLQWLRVRVNGKQYECYNVSTSKFRVEYGVIWGIASFTLDAVQMSS